MWCRYFSLVSMPLFISFRLFDVGKPIEEYRRQLGSFGVCGDLALQPVGSLSGGQKSRVAFAKMCMSIPNFLILDEPTNHLDIETIEALGKAINTYQVGCLDRLLFSELIYKSEEVSYSAIYVRMRGMDFKYGNTACNSISMERRLSGVRCLSFDVFSSTKVMTNLALDTPAPCHQR